MSLVPFVILAASAVLCAGLIPGVYPVCATVAAAVLCAQRPFAAGKRRALWWAGIVLVLLVAITLARVPRWLAGTRRTEHATRAAETVHQIRATDADVADAADAPTTASSLSLNRPGTRRYLFVLLGVAALFWLSAGMSLSQRVRQMKLIVLLGTVVALSGIVGRFLLPQNGLLNWWYPVGDTSSTPPIGPFVSRNHFSAFCAMVLPFSLMLALPRVRERRGSRSWSSPRRITFPKIPFEERLTFLFCTLTLVIAVLLSRSRGGIAAAVISLLLASLPWLRASPKVATAFAVPVFLTILAIVFSPDPVLRDRLQAMRVPGQRTGGRAAVWADGLRRWKRCPVAGCGTHAYRTTPHYQRLSIEARTASHAESAYLTVLAERGLIGIISTAVVVVLWLQAACHAVWGGDPPWRRLVQRSHPTDTETDDAGAGKDGPLLPRRLAIAVAAAVTAMAAHAIVDVPLRTPLNAFLAATMAGMLMPLPGRTDAVAEHVRWLHGVPERLALVVLTLALLPVLLRGGDRMYGDRPDRIYEADLADVTRILPEVPAYWLAWYYLGTALERSADRVDRAGTTDRERLSVLRQLSLSCREQAAAFNVSRPEIWLDAARERARNREVEGARANYRRYLADQPTTRSVWQEWLRWEWYSRRTPAAHEVAAESEKHLSPRDAARLRLWLADRYAEQGSAVRERDALRESIRLLEMADNPQPRLWSRVAQLEQRLGYVDAEHDALHRSLVGNRSDAQAWWRIARIEMQRGRKREALQALGEAVRCNERLKSKADKAWADFILGREP